MRILADDAIPFAEQAFAPLGETRLLPGRAIAAPDVRYCDILFVRSVTRVDAELLRGSAVRFVGTATIGTDHVDVDSLRRSGIGFASATGSNANSVAEYVVCALLNLAARRGRALAGSSLGVVGVGNVGRCVARYAQALGMRVLRNDPPRARLEGEAGFCGLDQVLQADFVTLHVPLTRSGPDATWHLLDAERLHILRPESMLLNTARGEVVDNAALGEALRAGVLAGAVLDVWEHEPTPAPELMKRVLLGTPHIAGYSLDGKLAGTEAVANAACRHFGIEARWTAAAAAPSERQSIVLPVGLGSEDSLRHATRAVYDIERDDASLRGLLQLEQAARPEAFDRLRQRYPVRREFHTATIVGGSPSTQEALAALGFHTPELTPPSL